MVMTDEHSHDKAFEKLKADVKRVGWHIVLVPEDDEGPGFAYTIGVHRTLQHPELIIVGLNLDVMGPILNGAAEVVKSGTRFESGKRSAGVIERFDCELRAVHASHYDDYVGQAIRFYGDSSFPLLQCVWPDMQGRFSWERGVNPRLAEAQPLLDSPRRPR